MNLRIGQGVLVSDSAWLSTPLVGPFPGGFVSWEANPLPEDPEAGTESGRSRAKCPGHSNQGRPGNPGQPPSVTEIPATRAEKRWHERLFGEGLSDPSGRMRPISFSPLERRNRKPGAERVARTKGIGLSPAAAAWGSAGAVSRRRAEGSSQALQRLSSPQWRIISRSPGPVRFAASFKKCQTSRI